MTKFKTAVYRWYAFSECFLVQVVTTVRKILATYTVWSQPFVVWRLFVAQCAGDRVRDLCELGDRAVA